MGAATLVEMLVERGGRDGGRPAVRFRQGAGVRSVTWGELAADARRFAAALRRWGVAAGDRVVLLGENRYDWIVLDLALQLARAVSVPAHAAAAGEQIAEQIRWTGARWILVGDADQAAKLDAAADGLPAGLQFVSLAPCCRRVAGRVVQPLLEAAATVKPREAAEVERRALEALGEDSLATIVFTSGSSGRPKGVMLSQGNLAFNAAARAAAHGQRRDDVRLGFLPLSHIFGRTCDWYTSIASGAALALAGSPRSALDDCRWARPTLLNGVPYFFAKTLRVLRAAGREGEPGALRQLLGGAGRICCCGGAGLDDEVFDFYRRQGVPLLPGYGLTEASPVITASTPEAVRQGTVGRPLPGVEVRIAADGEVLTRGPHVMLGYWEDPAGTQAALRGGWLHTGDLGELDADGYLRLTGRKKEIIVTTGGKTICPSLIEQRLTADPLIAQAMVVGDGRDYLAALIAPDWEALAAELGDPGAVGDPRWAEREDVRRLYAERIRARQAGLSRYEQVQRVVLLAEPFSADRGELTLKGTLRRQAVLASRRELIERLYAPRSDRACVLTAVGDGRQ